MNELAIYLSVFATSLGYAIAGVHGGAIGLAIMTGLISLRNATN